MKIILKHGRKDPKQEMQEMGFEGATLEDVNGIIWTYGVPRVFFSSRGALLKAQKQTGWLVLADWLEMDVVEDMIHVKGEYFGDWELLP